MNVYLTLFIVVSVCGFTLKSCVSIPRGKSQPIVNTAYIKVSYAHTPDEVRRAFIEAVDDLNLRITSQQKQRIETVEKSGAPPTRVVIEFGSSDTLTTGVRVTSTYIIHDGVYTNYPLVIYVESLDFLGDDPVRYVHPQATYSAKPGDCNTRTKKMGKQRNKNQKTNGEVQEELPMMDLKYLQGQVTYTEEARQKGIEGNVDVKALVDVDGVIRCAKVQTGLPYGLNDAALQAVSITPFTPAKVNGKPIRSWVSIPIAFRLRHR